MRDRKPGEFPHVTDVLARAGLVNTDWFKEYDLSRGSALHKATEYLDEGTLDWSTVDPIILGRLRQYQRFKDEVRPAIGPIEKHVEHHAYHYQGTLDRLVSINDRLGVLDIKGPSMSPWQGVQVAAYAAACPVDGVRLARWTLHLSDENYRLVEHKDRNDFEVFKAALTLCAFKEKHGL